MFSMHWMLVETIHGKGQFEYNNNNKDVLEIIVPCTSMDDVDAYQWLSECNVSQFLQVKDDANTGMYKIAHREFSVERVKINGARSPSYIFDLVFVHGHKIATFKFGSKCSLTAIFGNMVPSKDYYKLCQWNISITSPEALITLPREFRYVIIKPKYLSAHALWHNGKAGITSKGDNLVVTSTDFGAYIVEMWVKQNIKPMTRKNRVCRKNITKKITKNKNM